MNKIIELLGNQAEYYLNHTCKTIDKSLIHVPSPDTIDKIWIDSDRNIQTLRSLQTLLGHGRLANTGYVSILPVDQDIEHTAGASFAPNPIYFDPENIVKLAIEGGCNAQQRMGRLPIQHRRQRRQGRTDTERRISEQPPDGYAPHLPHGRKHL